MYNNKDIIIKVNIMKLSIWLKAFVFTALVGGGLVADASANSLLFIAPHRVVIAPDQRTTEVTVANQSETKRRYEITMIDSVMTETGSTKRVDTFEYSAKRMVRYVPRAVELAPGERQTVRLMVRRPKDLADGDYHSHLLFREKAVEPEKPVEGEEENKFSFQVGAQYGVAIPVIVQQGTIEAAVKVGDVTKTTGEQKGLTVTFNRTGNAEAGAYLRVFRVEGGAEKAISAPLWVRIYREVGSITRNIPLMADAILEGKVILRLYTHADQDAETLDVKEVTL